MTKIYPYLTGIIKIKVYRNQKCARCRPLEVNATHKIEMQTSLFRGDDVAYWVCEPHLALAKENNWDKFFEVIEIISLHE